MVVDVRVHRVSQLTLPSWVRSKITIAITCVVLVYISSFPAAQADREGRDSVKDVVYPCLYRAYMRLCLVRDPTFEIFYRSLSFTEVISVQLRVFVSQTGNGDVVQ